MSDPTTTIQLSKHLRNELAKLGSKDDTFETILRRLLQGKGTTK
jgi:hypothetical protein